MTYKNGGDDVSATVTFSFRKGGFSVNLNKPIYSKLIVIQSIPGQTEYSQKRHSILD